MSKISKKVVKICFYCKKPVGSVSERCSLCHNNRFINVDVKVTRLTPWYNFWTPKYSYEVINPRYKFIEKYL